jgi:hypothetical protein
MKRLNAKVLHAMRHVSAGTAAITTLFTFVLLLAT